MNELLSDLRAAYELLEQHSGEGHPDIEALLEDLRAIICEEDRENIGDRHHA